MGYKQTLSGGVFAMILATSCCWLPTLAIVIGGTTGILGLSENLERYSGFLMAASFLLIGLGGYQYNRRKKINDTKDTNVILRSTITCPKCGHGKEETMPTNACQFFYDCEKCREVMRPKEGDCCVFCSFGPVKCPPIQEGDACC